MLLAKFSENRAMNDKIKQYIESLTTHYSDIKSIWLIGSRANNSHREDSDWDLLVFADNKIFNELKLNKTFRNNTVDLLIVFDNQNFEKPWADEKGTKNGSLSEWKWNELSSNEATYKSVKYKSDEWFKEDMIECKILKAFKIWH